MIKDFLFFFRTYKSLTVGDIPEYIHKLQRDLCAILIEISEAHFESASQAIKAYNVSGRQTEMESAIAHLRDVFNIAKRSIYKEKRYSYLFGFISGNEPAFSCSERIMIIFYLGMIAKLISRIYLFLGETKNSDSWLEECRYLEIDLKKQLSVSETYGTDDVKSNAQYYLSNGKEMIFLNLYEIDENYLTYKNSTRRNVSTTGASYTMPTVEISISEKGREFLLDKLI